MKSLIAALLFVVFLHSAASAQVVGVIPIMSGNAPSDPHDYSFGPTLLPVGVQIASVVITSRDALKSGTMTVVIERSLNGGASFEPAGGAVFDAITQPQDFDVIIGEPLTPFRVLRGRVTLFGQKWRGDVVIELK